MDDPAFWHRLQFAFTITYHYLFPQLTMGLTPFLVLWRWRTFPVMLRSTLDPTYSITAQAGAVGGAGLGLALFWWPVAMALSVGYAVVVFRQFSGKVRMTAPSSVAIP